jgi:hypothetical protein
MGMEEASWKRMKNLEYKSIRDSHLSSRMCPTKFTLLSNPMSLKGNVVEVWLGSQLSTTVQDLPILEKRPSSWAPLEQERPLFSISFVIE